jgi:hypothetical protein
MQQAWWRIGLGMMAGAVLALGQTGTAEEPLRYLGGIYVDQEVHDGRLRPAVGVESYQVMRANRTHKEWGDGFGWTYSHAAMLAHWQGRFYLQYLSNPVGEHEPPGQTLLVTSADGRTWGKPEVVFPPYERPAGVSAQWPKGTTGYMMHQRMGFYVAPNGRLLTVAFYGHSPDPFAAGGIGRVAREIKADGSLGPIHFVKYNTGTPWNESNTAFPFYKKSADPGFVEACEALLGDGLMTSQWRDEEPRAEGAMPGPCSSVSYYHRADGKVVGVCKNAMTALTEDGGRTWSKPVRSSTLITNNAKVWGQKTADGRYALVYNPVLFGSHRWPLVVSTGADGVVFDTMLGVNGEVPPRRFIGKSKDFGAQYMRGIAEGNGDPRDGGMWLAYSMNKEDIWVSRVPVPVTGTVEAGLGAWNVYSPLWAPVRRSGDALEMRDKDPFDYGRAIRVFPESRGARVEFRVKVESAGRDGLEVEVGDRYGNRPVRLIFGPDGWLRAQDGARMVEVKQWKAGEWVEVEARVGVDGYGLTVGGASAIEKAALAEAVLSFERISFRTGAYRNEPNRRLDRYDPRLKDLEGADEPVAEGVFRIEGLRVTVK